MAEGLEGYERVEDDAFNSFVADMYAKKRDDGTLHFKFKPEKRHLNGGGVVHGGMLMTFADLVLGHAVWAATDEVPCTTMSLNCDFVGPGKLDEWIEGTATITRKTRSIVFVQGELTSGGRTVLSVTGIWKIIGV